MRRKTDSEELPDEIELEDEIEPDDAIDIVDESEEAEEGSLKLNLITMLILLIAAAVTTAYFMCTVRTVHVTGNKLYTSQEIAEQVISDDTQLRHNTVFLAALYMTPFAPRIPFEERVRVHIESYDTIRIEVKDMDLAAYIPYGGRNLYFTPDGIVLEHSPLIVKSATFVTGLPITSAERGMKMEAEDQAGLDLVLEALQILDKYEMRADCIVLGKTGSVTMYLDHVKVQLGRSDFELKIGKLAQIHPYLEGRSGTINMTNYTDADENIILK